jgi:hypothetical protein
MINILSEPEGDDYRQLVQFCATCSYYGSLILRDRLRLDADGERLVEHLAPHVIDRRVVTEWPGTQLFFGETALQMLFVMNSDTTSMLIFAANRLYDWTSPALPEDLCLLRRDESPVLVTISHERDSFVEGDSEFENRFIRRFDCAAFRIERVKAQR